MLWALQWGEHREFLVGIAEEAKTPDEIPPSLEKEPTFDGFLAEVFDGFWIMTNSRRVGMGVGGIPMESIEAYCRMHDVENVPRFVRFITYLDSEFLSWAASKAKSQT